MAEEGFQRPPSRPRSSCDKVCDQLLRCSHMTQNYSKKSRDMSHDPGELAVCHVTQKHLQYNVTWLRQFSTAYFWFIILDFPLQSMQNLVHYSKYAISKTASEARARCNHVSCKPSLLLRNQSVTNVTQRFHGRPGIFSISKLPNMLILMEGSLWKLILEFNASKTPDQPDIELHAGHYAMVWRWWKDGWQGEGGMNKFEEMSFWKLHLWDPTVGTHTFNAIKQRYYRKNIEVFSRMFALWSKIHSYTQNSHPTCQHTKGNLNFKPSITSRGISNHLSQLNPQCS